MARPGAVYEITDTKTREVLSRHRTRQAALNAWRLEFTGITTEIWRRTVPRGETLIVEGTWYKGQRPG